MKRYLDPRSDRAFKKIFGQEKHKNLPISFLNELLELKGEDRIVDLEFLPVQMTNSIEAFKDIVLDIYVKDQRDQHYNIEIQLGNLDGFEKRVLYHASNIYSGTLSRGMKFRQLPTLVILSIVDEGIIFPQEPDYKTFHHITNAKTGQVSLTGIRYVFVELKKFNKTLTEIPLTDIEGRWCYFLKNTKETNSIDSELLKTPEICQAVEILDHFGWTPIELAEYASIIEKEAEVLGRIDYAAKAGKAEGEAKGKAEGKAEGRAETAKNMKLLGVDVKLIAQATGLTLEEIDRL